MNPEEQLLKQFGRERHFSVPEAYFANLDQRIMARLDGEQAVSAKHVSIWQRMRPKLSVAAMVAVMLGVGAYFHFVAGDDHSSAALASSHSQVSASSTTFDQAADYIMIDESDMYAYLADY